MGGVQGEETLPGTEDMQSQEISLKKVASREMCRERTQVVTGGRRGEAGTQHWHMREGKMRGTVAAHMRENEGLEREKDA